MSKPAVTRYLKARREGDTLKSPRVTLTQDLCDWLPVETFDYTVRDDKMRGLLIRVRTSGHKTLDLVKRVGAKVYRPRVCELNELPFKSVGSGDTVRSRAEQTLAALRNGEAPAEKKAQRVQERRREGTTWHDAATQYIELKPRAESTTEGYKRFRDSQLALHWQNKMIGSTTPDQVIALHTKISRGNGRGYGPVAANNVIRFVRAVWKANKRRLGLGECPTVVFTSEGGNEVAYNPEKRRTRHIRKGELADWWAAVQALRTDFGGEGDLMADYLEFGLLTGMRRREITSLWRTNRHPNYIDIRNKDIVIRDNKSNGPTARQDRTLRLPITPAMQDIIDRRAAKGRVFNLDDPKRAIAWVERRSGVKATSHDLRRSILSYATGIGVPLSVAKELVNHSRNTDVTEGYIQIDEDTRRDYLQRIQSHMLSLAGAINNVVKLEVSNG